MRKSYSNRRNYINKYRRAEARRKQSRAVAKAIPVKKYRWGAVAFAAAVMIFSLLFIFKGKANAGSDDMAETYNGYYKYYTCITVESGDTLSMYAEKYNNESVKSDSAYIEEICMINDIEEDKIVSGTNIILPYFDKKFK